MIETLVGSALFVIIALMADKAFVVLANAVEVSRAKVAATTVANEQFEIIRNLPYESVGVAGGIPSGVLQHNQTITRDNWSFAVTTTVRNVDDPFDGTIGGSPADTSPADYKIADLDITCSNCRAFAPLKFVTLVAPHALETASTNGALFVQVFDSNGLPVQGASITITNNQTAPATLIQDTTDNDGWLKIVDAPPGTNAYNIVATKSGYSTDQTYPLGGDAGDNPLKPDATVVIQQVTQTSLTIDETSTLNVATEDAACAALPSIGFTLTGTKLIGSSPDVLKYPAQDFTTDGSGNSQITPLEWDTYSAALDSGSYDLAGSNPLPSFALNPGETKQLTLEVVPHVDDAVLITVKDQNGTAVDGASVHLTLDTFDETKTTNSSTCSTPGEVFWNGLSAGTYNITVSKTGFGDFTGTIDVSAPWSEQDITLNPS